MSAQPPSCMYCPRGLPGVLGQQGLRSVFGIEVCQVSKGQQGLCSVFRTDFIMPTLCLLLACCNVDSNFEHSYTWVAWGQVGARELLYHQAMQRWHCELVIWTCVVQVQGDLVLHPIYKVQLQENLVLHDGL